MNQLDDLFSKKLKNLEVPPSDRANALFAQKLANRKKGGRKLPILLWFSMAASLFIVAFVGLYFFKNSNNSKDSFSQKANIKTIQNKVIDEKEIQLFPKTTFLAVNPEIKNNFISGNNEKNVESTMDLSQIDTHNTSEIINEIINEIKNENVIAENTIADKDTQLGDKSKPFFDEETIVFLTPMMTIGSYPRNFENKNPINIDIKNNPNEDYFSEDKSLFVRVIEEVKNLKKGEKVDFQHLGFKPIEELAMNQDGFIVSETKQIKDKINWIKARLNNN